MLNLLTIKNNFEAKYLAKDELPKLRTELSNCGGVKYITFKEMVKKYPQVEPLSDLTAFKIFESKQKRIEVYTLTIKEYENKLVVILPDFQNSKIDADVLDFTPRLKQATVKIEGIEMIVSTSLNTDGLSFAMDKGDFTVSGDEIDTTLFNNYTPNKYIKLATIPKGKYMARLIGTCTDELKTPLASFKPLKSDSELEIKNVTCNMFLMRLLADNQPHKIEILGVDQNRVRILDLE